MKYGYELQMFWSRYENYFSGVSKDSAHYYENENII